MQAPKCAFVIFGITGDLSARKLMPALYALHESDNLHPESQIVGYARSDLSDNALRQEMRGALEEYVKDFSESTWDSLAPRLHYVRGQYDEAKDYKDLASKLGDLGLENRAFYTATPPSAYKGIISCMAKADLTHSSDGWVRIIIEKPFGHDLDSSKALNEHVLDHFDESQVYRIDHYLAKETAQNLSVLRFANTLFEPIWSNQFVDHVQITMTEPMGVEGRGGFYEDAGVIRDVFQNHLLQLLALVAMEPPAYYNAKSLRDEKVKVFQAMACLDLSSAVMGQYKSGNGMKGYREEEGVEQDSRTPTYAAASFRVNTWRWSGVPFYMRSGKRLETKASEIVLRFKKPPHIPFKLKEPLKADRLVLRLSPEEGISFRFNAKAPGQGIEIERINLSFSYDEEFNRPNPDAYETLLLDAMLGDPTLFMRADEVEAQWRIVDPLLEHWEQASKDPAFYEAGSKGPKEADDMLEKEGRYWHKPSA